MLFILGVLSVGLFVLWFVIFWKLFEKCGEAGWKAIIPFYDYYIAGKIAYDSGFGWFFLICLMVGGLMMQNDDAIGIIGAFIVLIMWIVWAFVIGERFNKSIGFKIALGIPFIQIFPLYQLAFNDDNVYEKKQPIEKESK